MNNKILILLALVIGVLGVALAFLYWLTPAGSLPSIIPGYESGSTTIHVKHGIGAVLLGLGAFAFAWFRSGKKSADRQGK